MRENIKNKCNDEAIYLKKVLKKYPYLVKETKKQITSLLIKMRDKAGINLEYSLSDGIFAGNIGIDNKEEKIKYLLSDKSTIREKISAISNIIYDPVKEIANEENGIKFYKYIMDNKNTHNVKKVYKMIQLVTKNKHPETLDYYKHSNISSLWCPLLYSFSGYIYKKSSIKLDKSNVIPSLNKNHIIEKLSKKEKEFISSKLNLSLKEINDVKIFKIRTGMNVYGDSIDNLNYYKYENNNCYVAGISGHSILHFTLGLIFDIDYRYILLSQMLKMTPMHHSMIEICWGANDMGFLKLFENYQEMRDTLDKIFKELNEMLSLKVKK